MKKLAIAASLVALAAPAAAGAHPHHAAGAGKAHKVCKQERAAIGKDAFKKKYGNERGKRSMQRCKRQELRQARQTCKAERAADKAAFRAKYGRGEKKRAAFPRCVRQNIS